MAQNIDPDTPFLTVPDLVELLGVSPGKIHRLIEERHVAEVRIDGVRKIPAEFVKDGEPLPSLRGTLLTLLDAGFAEEEAVAWLLADNDELGERPIDALRAGRKSGVRRATQGLAF
ncbi:Rv2175c family DNA-binding protein [Leucobacter sp. GX24907]